MEENKIAVQLSGMDVAVLLESLKYSIQRVSDAQGTPDTVRQEKPPAADICPGEAAKSEERWLKERTRTQAD